MIDVVYNHTSPDSVLWQTHPEFFYRRPDGRPGNHVGDWTDIIDLDYRVQSLWDYQVESLKHWAELVDGFRCDVAPLVPLEFWKKAREAVSKVNPDCIWLAESVHRGWAMFNRRMGIPCTGDYEGYEAFDMEYEYDIREAFEAYLKGEGTLTHYVDLLNFQEATYPENYIKLRFLENHDVPRICSYIKRESRLINFTAMLYFLKGATLIYGGQEFGNEYRPSLFEREVFSRNTGINISDLLSRMARIKKQELSAEDHFWGWADDRHHVAILNRSSGRTRKLGVFSLQGKMAMVSVDFPDGTYTNLVDDERITIRNGKLVCKGKPIILSTAI
jgi:glycosidase